MAGDGVLVSGADCCQPNDEYFYDYLNGGLGVDACQIGATVPGFEPDDAVACESLTYYNEGS